MSGEPDATHAAVVPLMGDGDVVGCTGTIIDERHVLTAAHCLVDGAPPLRVRIDGPDSTTTLVASVTIVHPDFAVRALGAGYENDVAILRLSETVTIEAMRIAVASPFEGQSATIVGYGRTALACAANDERRRGDMTVEALSKSVMELRPSPATTCYADSGGPVLVHSESGVPSLVGVVSTGSSTCDGQTIATRADFSCANWGVFSKICSGSQSP